MQTLQEERRIWGFYDGTPVERRQGCACVCMHVVCVNTCVCNGGSPVSCLQPCVHPQQSVCGEYDGKVHAHSLPAYSAETKFTRVSHIFCSIYVLHICMFIFDIYITVCVCVCVIFMCTGFSGLLPVSEVKREWLFLHQGEWDSSIVSPLAYLTPHSYVCELSLSALLRDPALILCYVTSASPLAARQRVCPVLLKVDVCVFVTAFNLIVT